MGLYKMECGRFYADPQEFDSPEEAWNTLRLKFDNHRSGILYEVFEQNIPAIDEEAYLSSYYGRYGTYSGVKGFIPHKEAPNERKYSIPLFCGLVSSPYSIPTNQADHIKIRESLTRKAEDE